MESSALVARRLQLAFGALVLGIGGPALAQVQDDGEALAGLYDGSRTEVAAALELSKDGRYRYRLSYGALDERSYGIWTRAGDTVILQSDPFTASTFEVSEVGKLPGKLTVELVLPDGFDAQYFAIETLRKDGSASIADFSTASLEIAMGDNPVASLRPMLPVMDLTGSPIAVPEGGANLKIAFKSNDLGTSINRLIRAGLGDWRCIWHKSKPLGVPLSRIQAVFLSFGRSYPMASRRSWKIRRCML